MPHIHTNPGEHDATASAFIVRFDTSEPKLLLHVHKKLKKLLQPGGHIELLENPWQAVLHEITEETGYELTQIDLLQPRERIRTFSGGVLHPAAVCQNTHDLHTEAGHKHSDTSYAFAVTSEPLHLPDEGESSEFRWCTLAELQSLNSTEVSQTSVDIGSYVLTVCATKWERVPLSDFEA